MSDRDDKWQILYEAACERATVAEARLLQAERERDEARNAWHVPATVEALAAHDREMRKAAEERASALAAQIGTLFDAIKHGDDKHQQWLKDKIDAHFSAALSAGEQGETR